jgi:hypothetical protein
LIPHPLSVATRAVTQTHNAQHRSFTDEQLTAIRGGLTAEEYRWKLIREWLEE